MQNTNYEHAIPEPEYIDLRLMLQFLLDKIWIIVAASISVFVITMIFSALRPVKYQASILLKIQHKQHNVLGTITNPNQQLGLTSPAEETSAMQIALIKSEFILRPVIKSLGLDINVMPDKSLMSGHFFKSHSGTISIRELEVPAKYFNQPLKLVVDGSNTYRLNRKDGQIMIKGREGSLATNDKSISIHVDHITAPAGSRFNITKISEFEAMNRINKNLMITDLSGSADNDANKAAILRISLIGDDPAKIDKILNQIAVMTQKKNVKLRTQEAEKTLTFLNRQLPIVLAELKQAEEKFNKYRSANDKIDTKYQIEYLNNHLAEIESQIEKLRTKKTYLLVKFTENHPYIIAINLELKQLAERRLDIIKQLKDMPASEQAALNLKREVEVKNNLYMILLNQIHQLEVIKTGIISDVEIISYASTPHKIQSTRLAIIGIFALIIGVILGCIGVLGWRMFFSRRSKELAVISNAA